MTTDTKDKETIEIWIESLTEQFGQLFYREKLFIVASFEAALEYRDCSVNEEQPGTTHLDEDRPSGAV